jgi:ribosomal-protein-alanine N-acetyltransferase
MQHSRNDFTLFLLTEKDAPELAELEAACFPTPWGEAQYRKILSRNTPAVASVASPSAGRAPPTLAARGARLPGHVRIFPESFADALPVMPVFGMRAAAGELAAYICLGVSLVIEEAEIYTLAVSAAFRRQGLGRLLLRHALQTATACGIRRALLEVRPSNAPALALYASLGFAVCGSRKKYYTDSGEDALILACDLA